MIRQFFQIDNYVRVARILWVSLMFDWLRSRSVNWGSLATFQKYQIKISYFSAPILDLKIEILEFPNAQMSINYFVHQFFIKKILTGSKVDSKNVYGEVLESPGFCTKITAEIDEILPRYFWKVVRRYQSLFLNLRHSGIKKIASP